jgi:hypothetical protein
MKAEKQDDHKKFCPTAKPMHVSSALEKEPFS